MTNPVARFPGQPKSGVGLLLLVSGQARWTSYFWKSDSNETNDKLILMLIMNHSLLFHFQPKIKALLNRDKAQTHATLSNTAVVLNMHVDYTVYISHVCAMLILHSPVLRTGMHTVCSSIHVIGATWIPDCNYPNVDRTCCFRCSVFYHAQCDKGHCFACSRCSTTPLAAQATLNPYWYICCLFHVAVWDWIT